MKKLILIFITVVLLSCSTKKDSFVNRNWHALNTRDNTLFNGKNAFNESFEALNSTYEDDYWQVLPIEPIKVDKDKILLSGVEGESEDAPQEFGRAEEKAVKAIQMHSMNIDGRERNSQIDDAYLLLGKGRYYSQRFVPALEAFNYVLENYPNANLINDTKIWRAKTNVRLQNEEQAIVDLTYLLKKQELEDNVIENANTAMAMAYKSLDSVEAVIYHLNKATVTHKNREQQARNLFILGQLYRNEQKIDSSQIAFQKIIDAKKIPRKYSVFAQIEQAKNHTNGENADELLADLAKLIKDRDNRPYLDALHYQAGMLMQKQENIELAEAHFQKSVQAKDAGDFQKSLSYEALGNLKFDKAKFLDAGAYYDSVLAITENQNTKRIRRIIRKREKLNDVIAYEHVATRNDSILDVVAMSEDAQRVFFEKHIEKLKEQAEREKIIAQNTSYSGMSSSSGGQQSVTSGKDAGKWYFYNVQSVGFGMQEFKKRWGNRPLEDNWRLSEKLSTTTNSDIVITVDEIDASKKYDIDYYLEKIPTSQTKIDSISTTRNGAYYQLGLLYKEQFKENQLALDRLEKLLTFSPKESIALPAKYHIYKIYESMNASKAMTYKNDIIKNHPNSKYATILQNPEEYVASLDGESQAEVVYKEAFLEYEEENFAEVITISEKAIQQFVDNEMVAKFDLLKTYAIAKTQGLEPFKKGLEFVVMNYPNTIEGKHAQDVLDTLNGKNKKKLEEKPTGKEKIKESKELYKKGGPSKKEKSREQSVQKMMQEKEKERKALEKKIKK